MLDEVITTRALATAIGAELLRTDMLGVGPLLLTKRYEIAAILGHGASSVVVRARDTRLERNVALKLTPLRADTERMLTEARALAKLKRPRHVVQVMEVGSGALSCTSGAVDVAFVSMELVEGETLRVWLARGGRSLEQIVAAFQCLADGLVTAHSHGIVHGDVKPENAIIGNDGIPMLVDFGFAMAQRDDGSEHLRGEVVGTGPYLAPEARRGVVDRRSDVYALAVAMWESVTGMHPFGDKGEPETTWYGSLKPLWREHEVAKPLRTILRKALHPKPSRRPTAVQLRDQLEAFRKTLVGRFMRILRRLMIVSVIALVGLTGVVIGGYVAVEVLKALKEGSPRQERYSPRLRQ